MNSIHKVALACTIAAATMVPLTASAQASLPNQDTYFTFSQAVELPGTTLPAGTYLFVLADSPSNRHIVRVMSQDRSKMHATLLAIPNYTLDKPSEEPRVRFMEGPETGPQAIKVWFYPGRTVGHEFIYPRSQATKLAARTGESVLTTKTDTAVNETIADADMTRVDRTGADEAVNADTSARVSAQPAPATPAQTQAQTPQTQQRQSQTAESQTAAPQRAQDEQNQARQAEAQRQPAQAPASTPAPAEPVRTERTELPATASLLPLLALVGVGSIVGSRMLRARRTR